MLQRVLDHPHPTVIVRVARRFQRHRHIHPFAVPAVTAVEPGDPILLLDRVADADDSLDLDTASPGRYAFELRLDPDDE